MFDLDPSDDVGFPEVIEVALLVKQLLDLAGLESFPKTSGSRGSMCSSRSPAARASMRRGCSPQ